MVFFSNISLNIGGDKPFENWLISVIRICGFFIYMVFHLLFQEVLWNLNHSHGKPFSTLSRNLFIRRF